MSLRPSGTSFTEALLAALYIIITAVGTLSLFNGLPTALKAAYVPLVLLAAVLFLCGCKRENKKVSVNYLKQYLLYILLMFIMTSILYVVQKATVRHIVRGYEKLAFQTLTVLISVAAFYMFGRKAMDYTFYGFVLFYLISIALALVKTGFSGAWSSICLFVTSFGNATGFMKLLELHDAVFAFGMFIIYYLLKGVKKNIIPFCAAVFFFLIGFKRIGIAGVVLALAMYLILRKKPKHVFAVSLILGGLCMLTGFAYIAVIKYNIFGAVMNRLNLNTMGRVDLYNFINDYYRIGVTYIGKGFEYITLLMQSVKKAGYLNLEHIGALHNGYLTVYIEFGFFGYFLWTGFWLLWNPVWTKRRACCALLAQLLVTAYLFITYITDNTAFYFSTGIVARLLPMVFAQELRKVEPETHMDEPI